MADGLTFKYNQHGMSYAFGIQCYVCQTVTWENCNSLIMNLKRFILPDVNVGFRYQHAQKLNVFVFVEMPGFVFCCEHHT